MNGSDMYICIYTIYGPKRITRTKNNTTTNEIRKRRKGARDSIVYELSNLPRHQQILLKAAVSRNSYFSKYVNL